MLQHLLLCAGNGYEWGPDGQIRSVFAHIQPDYSTLGERRARADSHAGRPAELQDMLEDWEHRGLQERTQVRATARQRARTYGPVTVSAGSRTADSWGLLASKPQQVHPAWQDLLGEAERVFAAARSEQDAAEADLRQQWDRNPAARAAQLLTGELGRAWTADQVTDAELASCDQLLATWRHPAWPSRLDHPRLREQRDRSRAQRAFVRQILADDEQATPTAPGRGAATRPAAAQPPQTPVQPRLAHAILQALSDDQLTILHSHVRPVPYTGWHEWQWTRNLLRELTPAPAAAASPPGAATLPGPGAARQRPYRQHLRTPPDIIPEP